MRNRFKETYLLIRNNFKTLVAFEAIYRIIGVLLIFPVLGGLFFLSIRLSGYRYITNALMIDYLQRPTTILILFVMLFILGVYVAFEMVVLSLLFRFSRSERNVTLRELMRIALRKLPRKVKRFHILFVLLALVFFITVNLAHVSGIASTLAIPQFITDNIFAETLFIVVSVSLSLALFIVFVENIFSMNVFTLENKPLKKAYRRVRSLLKGNRGGIIVDFIVLNVLLNLIFYAIYLLIMLLIAGFIFITRGQTVLLGALLTVLYTVYVGVALVASFILLPVNYAWMSEWYHEKTPENEMDTLPETEAKPFKFLSSRFIKPAVALGLAIALILNGTTVYAAVQRRGGLDYFNAPDIVAHRGSSLRAPENTMAAIELAIEENSDAVEFDVLLTSDNVPVLMHDTRTGRTTDDPLNRRVADMTYEEIRELDAGSWFSDEFEGEPIPTLEEALNAINGHAKAYIDLKDYSREMVEITVETVERLDMVDDVKILTFSSDQLKQVKELNEDIETLYLVISFYGSINALIDIDHVDAYGFNKYILMENPRYADAIRSAGKDVYVWTVNSQTNLRNIRDIGVDGIITDDPILAREVVYDKYANPRFSNLMRMLFSE